MKLSNLKVYVYKDISPEDPIKDYAVAKLNYEIDGTNCEIVVTCNITSNNISYEKAVSCAFHNALIEFITNPKRHVGWPIPKFELTE